MSCGVDEWALTKMDVLDGFDRIKLCVAYELDGLRIDTFPANIRAAARCKPVYEEMPGWKTPLGDVRSFDALPPEAQAYLRRIETLTGVPVGILSLGPRRDQTFAMG